MMIPVAEPDLSGKEAEYAVDAITKEGRVSSSGKYLDAFEEHARKAFQRTHALSTSNGTTALHLALLGLGIGPDDEVIVPVLTFVATAAIVCHCGATPIFVDIKKDDWTIDTTLLEAKRTSRTKAVIAVDLYGMPCDYTELEMWCKANNVFLIEDAAEAHGATYNGKPVGSFGDVSCFSFFGNKILTTGEGGMCLTNDPELHERMRVLKNHGMTKPGRYIHDVIGYNYRMTNVQAAIGCAQFERFADFLEKRRILQAAYSEVLSTCPSVTLQQYSATKQPVFWLYSILVDYDTALLQQQLKEKEIDSRTFFVPLHQQPAYRAYSPTETFPVAEYISTHGISLPSSTLLTAQDVHSIAERVQEILLPHPTS